MKNHAGQPDSTTLSTLLRAATDARIAASEVLLRRYADNRRPLETWEKSPGALVTDADMASDVAIADSLRCSGVGGRIISEETPSVIDAGSPYEWLVDPLCGTVPFSTGMPHWGVNIAVRQAGELVASSFATPVSGDAIDCVSGSATTGDGTLLEVVPPTTGLGESTIGLEIDGKDVWDNLASSGGLKWVSKIGQANSFASAAYPLMQVCHGRMSGLVFYRIEPMHVAAGAFAAECLGIKVTDGHGDEIDWSTNEAYPIFVVAWDSVHGELIDALSVCM